MGGASIDIVALDDQNSVAGVNKDLVDVTVGSGRLEVPAARNAQLLAVDCGFDPGVIDQLGALWGKSAERAGGRMNLLVCHLLDTAAVAEQMWLHYLAPAVRSLLDNLSSGDGQRLFMWLCGLHDCGKATPAFQCGDEESARRVRASGLSWNPTKITRNSWRHDKAGGKVVRDVLRRVWSDEQVDWVWPLVAGHHGSFPSKAVFAGPQALGEHQGRGDAWPRAQLAVVTVLTRALGYQDIAAVQPCRVPSKAEQLLLSGLIVMADWIASDKEYFQGLDRLDGVSIAVSRERATTAWRALGLRGGWGTLDVADGDLISARFGVPARPFQQAVVRVARTIPAPGLMIVEAPMGEGKTRLALAVAEVLAARFGADGVFVGMPTQATSDPMFSEVRKWAAAFGADVAGQIALLHGKRRFNREWRALLGEDVDCPDERFEGVGEDEYGVRFADQPERTGPAEWFLGRKRGLLCASVVGTIDQLLHAATRTRHVMLRFAGLAGKVVILDEVHAADIYMEQFLAEALWWLGQARVPVIMLSATLPPRQRRALIEAYLAGARGVSGIDTDALPEPGGYPSVTAAFAIRDEEPGFVVEHTGSWRGPVQVAVEVLPDASNDTAAVVERIRQDVAEQGVVLVIHNTVDRAQQTYRDLRKHFGQDVRLLHGRLSAADRADRTEECLRLLKPDIGKDRPRMIVVATQLAEQSFDLDADLLITDLAPIDLLLQRIGRLHRHPGTRRPSSLATPRVVVTGFAPGGQTLRVLPASEAIYGRHRLLRAATLVIRATETGWSIPAGVPGLVAQAYGDGPLGPPEWPDAETAHAEWLDAQRSRASNAEAFLLTKRGERTRPTLDGLHRGDAQGIRSEDDLTAVVRDGEPSIEVIIVRRRRGGYAAWNGVSLGVNGEASTEVLDDVLGGTTRLPISLTKAAEADLRPLDGWSGHPWLRYAKALVLEESGYQQLGRHLVHYDDDLGLVVTKPTGAPKGRT